LICDTIKEQGLRIATSDCGNPIYEVAIELLTSVLNKTATAITTALRQLHKDGIIIYTPPFNGKLTRVLKDITEQDLEAAQYRRDTEWKKVAATRDYLTCPDENKQNFIIAYFSV
jgi:NAD(P)H-dependent FMN reductase